MEEPLSTTKVFDSSSIGEAAKKYDTPDADKRRKTITAPTIANFFIIILIATTKQINKV
jgi:hypothetical protein